MSNVFIKIINKEIPAEIIYEDSKVIAFKDIKPKHPGHFLVIPKKPSRDLSDIDDRELSYLMLKARSLALKVIKQLGVSGFNLIVNSGKTSGQEVFHTHVHIIPALK